MIDASTAHRVANGWVYGFAEMDADHGAAIAGARRVANPGCWPQGVIACLRPLILAGILPNDYPVTASGISGYTGGGRQMIQAYEAREEHNAPYMPYALGLNHKHLPEMKVYAGLSEDPLFQPVVGAFAQGMVPLHLRLLDKVPSGAEIHAAIADHFAGIPNGFVEVAPFVAVDKVPELDPETYNGTNRMRLHVFANDRRAQAVLVAVYDNLGKGASGAAVQNLNLMLGVDAATSLAA